MRILLLQVLVFLASFLIFQVELILGKLILPGFGGGYLVWGITVVFYQAVLFLGYAWVHAIHCRFSLANIKKGQTTFLLLSLLLLPINAERLMTPTYKMPVVIEIIWMLLLTIGVLFFLLSTLSVYLQVHLSASNEQEKNNPYVLYAASNLGAFASLITYPFFWETQFDVSAQLFQWEVGYAVVVVLFVLVQWQIPTQSGPEPLGHRIRSVDRKRLLKWLALSAAPSALFLATTNELTFNIAPVPLLWILPLSIYLLTLVLAFKKKPFCPAFFQDRFLLIIAFGTVLFLYKLMGHSVLEFLVLTLLGMQMMTYLGAVLVEPLILLFICFVFCLVCHYRLQEEKPEEAGQLTAYYLALSAGGFLGGFMVNWLAPLIFNVTLETLISFFIGMCGLAYLREPADSHKKRTVLLTGSILATILAWSYLRMEVAQNETLMVSICAVLVLIILFFILGRSPRRYAWVLGSLIVLVPFLDRFFLQEKLLLKARNYYGVYRVIEEDGVRKMKHGTTLHGAQLTDPARKHESITYYHAESPMGLVFSKRLLSLDRVSLIGLGAGSMASFSHEGDVFDFFELDPKVGEIAQDYFSYIKNSAGAIRLIYGDARVSLRDRPDHDYDAMIVDVFNSGAIPVHLMTVEAFEEFLRVLRPDGVMFFHVSNQFLNLIPVLYANARALGLKFSIQYSAANHPPLKEPTLWVALTRSKTAHQTLVKKLGWKTGAPRTIAPWTDRHTSIWPVLIR